jgi:hypothetical protein
MSFVFLVFKKGNDMEKIKVVCLVLLSAVGILQAEFSPFAKPEAGFIKYSIPTTHLKDASGNSDYIKTTKTHFAPLVRLSLGWQYDDLAKFRSKDRTTGRFGLSVQYARKGNAVVADYYDEGFLTASFFTRQDIDRVDALLFAEYDFAKWYGFQYTVGGGVGFVHGALKELRVYEKSNNGFIGQSLKPDCFSPTGYLSLAARRSFKAVPSLTYELGYHLGITGVRYKALVVQSQPDADAGLFAENAFNLLNDISLVKAPRFVPFSHELTIGFQWDF